MHIQHKLRRQACNAHRFPISPPRADLYGKALSAYCNCAHAALFWLRGHLRTLCGIFRLTFLAMFPAGQAFMQPMGMFMQQQPCMQQSGAQQPTAAQPERRQKITTGVVPLTKMPNKHKVETIEAVVPH